MTLKDNFYHIKQMHRTDVGVKFLVHFNVEHFIYAAHFPGNPITPGVCIVQIVKELTEELTQTPLFLKTVKNIKFVQAINPLTHPEVTFALSMPISDNPMSDNYRVSASVESGEVVFAKMSLIFSLLIHN